MQWGVMRWGPLAFTSAAIAVDLFVAAILMLSVMPLASGGLQINPGDDGSTDTSFQDGVLTMSLPLEAYNGGYFDIDDVRASIKLSRGGEVLAEGISGAMHVQAGKVNELHPVLSFDLKEVDKDKLAALVFERSELEFDIRVEGSYALGLIDANVGIKRTVEWEPLVSDLGIELEGYEIVDSSVDVILHYSFGASSVLHGLSTDLALTLKGAGGVLGDGGTSLVVGPGNEGTIRVNVPADAVESLRDPQVLTLEIGIMVEGLEAQLERTIDWEGMEGWP